MDDININSIDKLILPSDLRKELKISYKVSQLVNKTRNKIKDIITGKSSKKLFIVGPCSIHNVDEALEYGKMLKKLSDKVKDHILIVMRVYFEKPRTTIGWKGLINDPDLNGSYNVNKGLFLARKLLLDLNDMGLPCGYEALDTITPQYISDLVSWSAIGARTTESQVHREMVSGLSMPVGFKNGTGGSKKLARDAVLSARYSHCFMGININGKAAIVKTNGNVNCHVILRGGNDKPNYYLKDILEMEKLLVEKNLPKGIMVDCSHGNSRKDYKKQKEVLETVIENITINNMPICGVMIESNINEGKQKYDYLQDNPNKLKSGISITDSCISFNETKRLILTAYNDLKTYNIKMSRI